MGCGCKVASDDNRAAACRAASRLETWGLPRCGAHASRIEYAVNMLHLSNSAVLVPLSSALLKTSQAQYHSDCFRQSETMLQRRRRSTCHLSKDDWRFMRPAKTAATRAMGNE